MKHLIIKYRPSYCLLIACAGLFFVACDQTDHAAPRQAISMASEQKIFRWKMVTTWPVNFPVFQDGAEKFADDVRTISGGRLDIHVYAGGELVPPLQVFDAVSQGTVEMGHGSPYYWAGKVPAAQFFSSVPFGMMAKGMNAWFYQGGGLELWEEVYAPFNILPLPMGNTGVQMGGWFNKKIESLADIKGLRMRIPGLGGKVLKRAGGNPILLPGSEVYTALDRRMIDATEWVSPFHDLRLGLNRAARYYYFPGWHEPGTAFELMINRGAWEKLPDDLKTLVKTAAAAINEWIYAQMEFQNQAALQILKAKENVEILPFPPTVLAELKHLTKETLDEEAATDPTFKKVYDAYTDFANRYREWSIIADEAYQTTRRDGL